MKVTIESTNKCHSMFVFSMGGEYGYFELLGAGEIEIGDTLIGDFSSLGGTTARVKQSGEMVDTSIEGFCSLENAMRIINSD